MSGPSFEGYQRGAGDGTRTRDLNLGKVALYQLSYACIAERVGVEPTGPLAESATLPTWCLRPLGHLSMGRLRARTSLVNRHRVRPVRAAGRRGGRTGARHSAPPRAVGVGPRIGVGRRGPSARRGRGSGRGRRRGGRRGRGRRPAGACVDHRGRSVGPTVGGAALGLGRRIAATDQDRGGECEQDLVHVSFSLSFSAGLPAAAEIYPTRVRLYRPRCPGVRFLTAWAAFTSGSGRIRTCGTPLEVRPFSRRVPSTTRPRFHFGCGEGGIRTHGTRKGPAVFKTAALNRSATSPRSVYCTCEP